MIGSRRTCTGHEWSETNAFCRSRALDLAGERNGRSGSGRMDMVGAEATEGVPRRLRRPRQRLGTLGGEYSGLTVALGAETIEGVSRRPQQRRGFSAPFLPALKPGEQLGGQLGELGEFMLYSDTIAFNNIAPLTNTVPSTNAVTGTFGAEELIGILGESVTFQVKTSPPFETISLNKIINSNAINVALVTFKKLPCDFLFLRPDFQKRLNISSDCRNLHLGPLEKEDTGTYSVEIFLPTERTAVESFDLRVFKRLVDYELKVTCTPEGTGNRTWQLTCSTGTWEDRVNISWTSSAQSTGPTPGSSVIRFVPQEFKATCRAENPVSQASRTVSLKEVCSGKFFSS
ncbi:SLAM family member 6-like [Thamnophis elegans]|uniref:SLAM family member 6-like n=1 Tax=Thamnophis elegans TaxID=35005 RepID=UPI001377CA4A|nr:SLAM family member 6-like [Thamnophis elegans]